MSIEVKAGNHVKYSIKLSGQKLPEAIPISLGKNEQLQIRFHSDFVGTSSGFKVTFSTSYDPGMLMHVSDLKYLDGLRSLHQDIKNSQVDSKVLKMYIIECN